MTTTADRRTAMAERLSSFVQIPRSSARRHFIERIGLVRRYAECGLPHDLGYFRQNIAPVTAGSPLE
jgi:hypothetical protein